MRGGQRPAISLRLSDRLSRAFFSSYSDPCLFALFVHLPPPPQLLSVHHKTVNILRIWALHRIKIKNKKTKLIEY